jgi:hypothetical protein
MSLPLRSINITLITSGESVENPNPFLISREMWNKRDCPLTLNGIEQAKLLKIQSEFDFLYISPLQRARDTLYYSNLSAKRYKYNDPLVREVILNTCDLLHYPQEDLYYIETEEQIRARIHSLLKSIACDVQCGKKEYKEIRIGILSHPIFLFWLTGQRGEYMKDAEIRQVTIELPYD